MSTAVMDSVGVGDNSIVAAMLFIKSNTKILSKPAEPRAVVEPERKRIEKSRLEPLHKASSKPAE